MVRVKPTLSFLYLRNSACRRYMFKCFYDFLLVWKSVICKSTERPFLCPRKETFKWSIHEPDAIKKNILLNTLREKFKYIIYIEVLSVNQKMKFLIITHEY